MRVFRQHLQEVVTTRYRGSERRASLAAGLNENAVGSILANPNKLPTLETIDKLATAFQWTLTDAVYWALDKAPPAAEEQPAVDRIAAVLASAGYAEGDREFIVDMVRRLAPASSSESSSSNPESHSNSSRK